MPKIKRKAPNGLGTIYNREVVRKDGSVYTRWEASLSLGVDASGKRKRVVVYGTSQSEVLAKLDAVKRQVATGVYSEDKRTLQAYLQDWLEHKELETKPRTHEFYSFYALQKVSPLIGGIKLVKLNPSHVRGMMQDLASAVSADCANKCRLVLSVALTQAVKDGLIYRNPCSAVDPFRVEPRKDTTWANDEVMLFLSVARTHRFYAAFYLALSTGMRHGEILALRWEDIEGDTLYVRQSLIRSKGGYAISTPKTNRSIRRIALDPETVATLEEHRLKQLSQARELKDQWRKGKHLGLVFTSETGTPMHPRNFDRDWYTLQAATRKAYIDLGQTQEERQARAKQIEEGKVLPHIRFHDLRHMHVSLLNKAGIDARTISDRIGHTDPAFTLRRYAHVFEDQRKAAAIPLLRLLAPPQGEVS